jgi:hypothetical protein
MAVRPIRVVRVGVADRLRGGGNRGDAAAMRAHFGNQSGAAVALLLVAVVHWEAGEANEGAIIGCFAIFAALRAGRSGCATIRS